MEEALTNKCHEIKRQKGLVKSLLSQNIKEITESGTQVELTYKNFGQQADQELEVIEKIVEKIVEVPVTNVVEVEKRVEVPII